LALYENGELELLREILDPEITPRWSAWQASWRLIGIEPDVPDIGLDISEIERFDWLPGANREARDAQIQDERRWAKAFCRGDCRAAQQWILISLTNGHTPPWLGIARKDSDCRRLLPARVARRYWSARAAMARSRGGRARRNADKAWQAMQRLLPQIDAWLAQNPDYRSTRGALSKFANALACSDLAIWGTESLTKEAIENRIRLRKRELAKALSFPSS
jgi:hypothetical protein